ncbi:MAG TPA: acyloxyacyl hydrolase [Steroidobacteraceae bacterium]|nr:acyloxyacyl hydrolase [Steroidobacteraceae bacterium]
MFTRLHARREAGTPARARALFVALVAIISCCLRPHLARADSSSDADSAPAYSWTPWNPCPHCDLLVGAGTTYGFFKWTDGFVLPALLEIDDSRWELGAFRIATAQYLKEDPPFPASLRSANPEWGFTAMRRWQVLHRSWGKLYLGFGASYKTESDWLDASWNFAYLIGARFEVGSGSILELSVRHWSNAWFRAPNRGENLVVLTFGL